MAGRVPAIHDLLSIVALPRRCEARRGWPLTKCGHDARSVALRKRRLGGDREEGLPLLGAACQFPTKKRSFRPQGPSWPGASRPSTTCLPPTKPHQTDTPISSGSGGITV